MTPGFICKIDKTTGEILGITIMASSQGEEKIVQTVILSLLDKKNRPVHGAANRKIRG